MTVRRCMARCRRTTLPVALLVLGSCAQLPSAAKQDEIDWDLVMSTIEWPGIPWAKAEAIRDWFIADPDVAPLLGEPERLFVSIDWTSAGSGVVFNLLAVGRSGRSATVVAHKFFPRRR